jgi:hypothetical protein
VELEFLVDTEYPITELYLRGSRSGDWFTTSPLIELSSDKDSEIRYTWDITREFQVYYRPLEVPEREGVFRLYYYSVDAAGNEEYERYETIRVDTRDPILRVETMERGEGIYLVDCSGTTDGTELEFRILKGNHVIHDWTEEELLEIYLGEGDHLLTVETRDRAGNMASTEIEIEIRPVWLPLVLYGSPALAIIMMIGIFVYIHSRRNKRRRELLFRNIYVEPVKETHEAVHSDLNGFR